jgi:transcriptional regulator with XRE-family HTH domain
MEKIMIMIELVSRFQWNPELGQKLKLKRTARKLSRLALVEKIATIIEPPKGKTLSQIRAENLSTKYIERLERGEPNSISLESLLAIAKALNVGAEELLSAEGTIKIISQESA